MVNCQFAISKASEFIAAPIGRKTLVELFLPLNLLLIALILANIFL